MFCLKRFQISKSNVLVDQCRVLLRAGPLIKLSPTGDRQERHFFLFSDMIMYSLKKKAKYLYKVRMCLCRTDVLWVMLTLFTVQDHIELFELTVRAAGGEKVKGLSNKVWRRLVGLLCSRRL